MKKAYTNGYRIYVDIKCGDKNITRRAYENDSDCRDVYWVKINNTWYDTEELEQMKRKIYVYFI